MSVGKKSGSKSAPPEHRPPSSCRGIRFEVSDKELETANKWKEDHIAIQHGGRYPYAGAAGGAFSWVFTPTGLGVCIVLQCMCGDEKNVTDWEEFG